DPPAACAWIMHQSSQTMCLACERNRSYGHLPPKAQMAFFCEESKYVHAGDTRHEDRCHRRLSNYQHHLPELMVQNLMTGQIGQFFLSGHSAYYEKQHTAWQREISL